MEKANDQLILLNVIITFRLDTLAIIILKIIYKYIIFDIIVRVNQTINGLFFYLSIEVSHTVTLMTRALFHIFSRDDLTQKWKMKVLWAHIHIQETIYRSLRISRDGHLDQSEPTIYRNLYENTDPDTLKYRIYIVNVWTIMHFIPFT